MKKGIMMTFLLHKITAIQTEVKIATLALLFLFVIAVVSVHAQTVYFSDDFESGLGNWNTSWELTETDSVSATHYAADSPDENYPANASTEMTLLDPIDLSATVSPVLTFWQKIGVYRSDHGYLEISEDGGFTSYVLG